MDAKRTADGPGIAPDRRSDIPHRLATNNRNVEISYPCQRLSRTTQPVPVRTLTYGQAIWHAKCIRDRRLPGLQCWTEWPMMSAGGQKLTPK